MTDYIKKDDVLDIAMTARGPMDIREEEPEVAWVRGFNAALNSVYHLPAADVRPVRRGHWVRKHDDVEYWSECSECGRFPLRDISGKEVESDYCARCGAEMVTDCHQLEEGGDAE